MKSIKLFCIPYSGGSANVYYKWKKELKSDIELCPIEIAGRGRRINEPFYETVDEAAEDISDHILKEINEDTNYAIWGHSMGALLAYESYFKLMEKCSKEPDHIFFSGRKAPQDEMNHTEYYKLPDDEFLKMVFVYGGNTREIIQNEELAKIFIPILRADFKIAETYTYKPRDKKVMCDITVVNGKSDFSVMEVELDKWSKVAGKKCYYHWISGNHFFITENSKETVQYLNQTLSSQKLFV
jgi:linear gramicidin dehydrogenase lgrE